MTLYQKVEGWPDRVLQSHFADAELIGVEHVEATQEEHRLGCNLRVGFSYKGRRFHVKYAEEFQGELELVADGEKVFAMILGKEGAAVFGKDVTFLSPGGISAAVRICAPTGQSIKDSTIPAAAAPKPLVALAEKATAEKKAPSCLLPVWYSCSSHTSAIIDP